MLNNQENEFHQPNIVLAKVEHLLNSQFELKKLILGENSNQETPEEGSSDLVSIL